MLKRLLLPLCFLAASTACRKPEPIVTIQRVEVPVAVPCPAPPALPRPVSSVLSLPKDASPSQRAKAILVDLAAWVGYAMEEEQLLNGYRPALEPHK